MATLTDVMSTNPTLAKPAPFSFDTASAPEQTVTQPEATAPAPSVNTIDTNQVEAVEKPTVLAKETPVTEQFVPDVPAEDTEVTNLQAENDKLREDIKSGLTGLATEGEFTAQAEEDAGLVAKREAKTKIDNKVRQQQRDTDLALRDIDDSFGTRAQKTARKNELISKSNNRLADLSIIQMARGGELADAQATVDRKVELEFQDRRARIDALSFVYNENKDRLTTVEQRAYEKKIKTEERKYQKDYDKTQQLEDMKLQMVLNASQDGAGDAVLQQIQRATDIESLMRLPNAGRYSQSKDERLDLELKRANLANIYDQIQSRKDAARIALENATAEGATEQEVTDAEKKVATESLLEMQQVMTSLKGMEGLEAAVGAGLTKSIGIGAMGGSARADFETQANRLADMFLVKNLDKMTGVLTDKDLEVLRSEGTTIGNFDQSEKAWFDEYDRLEAMIDRGIEENGITDEQAQFYYDLEEDDVDSINSLVDATQTSTSAFDPDMYYGNNN